MTLKPALTAVESIDLLLDEVQNTLLLIGVPIACIKIKDKKHRTDACVRAFDWLHNLRMSPEYSDYCKVRALLPEETWQKYALFNITDLQEQKLLSQVGRALLKKWNTKRPALFSRGKK